MTDLLIPTNLRTRPWGNDEVQIPQGTTGIPPFVQQVVRLPGGTVVGVGAWTPIEIRVPSVLQPTWSPDDAGFVAPVNHLFDQNFRPQLYYTRDLNIVDPGVGVAPQLGLIHASHGPGIIFFHKPGIYWVNNPNTFAISALLIDADDYAAAWSLMDKTGINALTITGDAAATGTPATNAVPWNSKATYLDIYSASATTFLIAMGRNPANSTPGAALGVPVIANQVVHSPCPWALHTTISTAGALTECARFLYSET